MLKSFIADLRTRSFSKNRDFWYVNIEMGGADACKTHNVPKIDAMIVDHAVNTIHSCQCTVFSDQKNF